MPIVCDMSSIYFLEFLDFTKFDIIYAGAQKTYGTCRWTTLIVIKEEILSLVEGQF
jgi:phosphoserine aminotransferase